jgi:hypothetical protein
MALTEKLVILVQAKPDDAVKAFLRIEASADKAIGKAENRLDKLGAKFSKAGAGMLTAGGLAAAGLFKAGNAAAELEQAVGGTEAVFKDASGAIDAFATKAAQAVGLSEREFRTMSTGIGGQLKGLGFDLDVAAQKSIDLTKTAADLAATYGGSTADAVQAIGAAFRGEADPAERFNLFLNQTRVNAKAVELGLAATTSSVDANAKAQAVLALITEQSADAQGQFARESDTALGAQARFRAESENLQAALGQAVLPLMASFADGLGSVASGFNSLDPGSKKFVSNMALTATGVLLAGGAVSTVIARLIKMRDTFVVTGVDGTKSVTKLGKALGALGAVGALAGVVTTLKSINDEAGKITTTIADLAGATDKQLAEAFLTLRGAVDTTFIDAGEDLKFFEQAAKDNIGTATRMRDALVGMGVDVKDLDKILEKTATAQARNAEDTDKSADAVDRFSTATEKAKPKTADFGKAIDRPAAAAERLAEELDRALKHVDDLYEKSSKSQGATLDLEEAFDDLTTAVQENGKTLDIESEAGRENRLQALDLRDALLEQGKSYLEQGDSAEVAAGKVQGLVDRFKKHLELLGFNRAEIKYLIDDLDLLPRDITLAFDIDLSRAQAALDRLQEATGGVALGSLLNDPKYSQPKGTPPKPRARGGPLMPGVPYLFGEDGPEVGVFGSRGHMFDAPTSAAMVGGGTTVTNNIYNPSPEPASDSLRKVALEMAR